MKNTSKLALTATGLLLLGALLMFSTQGSVATTEASPQAAKEQEAVGYNPSAATQVREKTREMLGRKTLKDYHYKVHQNGNSCQLCHTGEAPTSPPDDANCIRCHGTPEQVAKLTENLERNPHNSPHYGYYVPCTTCHKEHQESKVLCADCHTFTFKKFKK